MLKKAKKFHNGIIKHSTSAMPLRILGLPSYLTSQFQIRHPFVVPIKKGTKEES